MPDWLYKFEQHREAIIGVILVAVVIYLPNGLVAPLRNLRGALVRAFRRDALGGASR
jgi:ABC-type branched-subunit amino acid transport system permease subunit